jgi:hypothetical protein
MTDRPPNWVLIEAAKRCGWDSDNIEHLFRQYQAYPAFRALCDMIQKYEQPPVDRKLLCAREAVKEWEDGELLPVTDVSIRAIELWEEGFGND